MVNTIPRRGRSNLPQARPAIKRAATKAFTKYLNDASAWLARIGSKGGAATSEKKTASAKRNGKRGGRPKEKKK